MPWHLAFTDLPALQDRCRTGVIHLAYDQREYAAEAALPRPGWSALTAETARCLRPAPDTPPGNLVELITLPDAPDHRAHSDAIAGYRPLGRDERLLGFTDCPPNQRTTTIDHAHGHRLGIHVDNFDRQPTHQIGRAHV